MSTMADTLRDAKGIDPTSTPAFGPLLDIPLDRIARDPRQPRADFPEESLNQLASSLQTRGQLQPALVRADPENSDHYILICGERRYQAARRAGLSVLTCRVAAFPFDANDTLATQIVENTLRENLSPIDQAYAFRELLNRNDWTHRQLADSINISHQAVTRSLALLDLPTPIKLDIERGRIAPATAYEISKLENPNEQLALAALITRRKFTRAEIETEVRERQGKSTKRHRTGAPSTNVQRDYQFVLHFPPGSVAVELAKQPPQLSDILLVLQMAILEIEQYFARSQTVSQSQAATALDQSHCDERDCA
jgi:ParB/RepB/Spo0J family partition protein